MQIKMEKKFLHGSVRFLSLIIQTWNEADTLDCFGLNTNINIKFGFLISSPYIQMMDKMIEHFIYMLV